MQDTTRLRILIVDDDQDITNVLKRGLESNGFTVDVFTRPTEALAKFDPTKYDSVVLDIKMPEMNGFQLARELWRRKEDLQVCFLSAFDINESEAKATLPNLKSHCFLTKPLLPSELAIHIQTHFIESTID